jgi:hypothetical protein
MTDDSKPERMLDAKEVADLLRLHPLTVKRAAREGRLIGQRTSGNMGPWRFMPSAVLAFQRGENRSPAYFKPQAKKEPHQ